MSSGRAGVLVPALLLTATLAGCSSSGDGYAPEPPPPTYPASAVPNLHAAARDDLARPLPSPTQGAAAGEEDDGSAEPASGVDGTSTQASSRLGPGDRGESVRQLQQRLQELGYWVGTADGSYGQTTSQAVLALQKANGLTRDGVLGPATSRALDSRPELDPHSSSGHVLEVDKARQLVLVVDSGRVRTIFNTSTGSNRAYREEDGTTSVATTPSGSFRITRQIDGLDHAPLGDLWRPKFFNRGIALHGASSIPGYPASHGCARMSNAAIDWIWANDVAPVGTRVLVY